MEEIKKVGNKNLKGKIDSLWEEHEGKKKKKKKKQFKLPFSITSQKGKTRKDHAIVQILKTNGAIDFKMLPITDNTVRIGETYHEATARHIMRYKRYPWLIVPEWNISPITEKEEELQEGKPFDPGKNLEKAVDEGKLSSAEKFIIHAIQMDTVKPKMKINILVVLAIIAAVIGLLWFLGESGVI